MDVCFKNSGCKHFENTTNPKTFALSAFYFIQEFTQSVVLFCFSFYALFQQNSHCVSLTLNSCHCLWKPNLETHCSWRCFSAIKDHQFGLKTKYSTMLLFTIVNFYLWQSKIIHLLETFKAVEWYILPSSMVLSYKVESKMVQCIKLNQIFFI